MALQRLENVDTKMARNLNPREKDEVLESKENYIVVISKNGRKIGGVKLGQSTCRDMLTLESWRFPVLG